MARKLPALQRALGAPVLFSVAYGEIASSIYFALGIIAGHALGLTPEVLLIAGFLFLLVALSYAEGTAAIPETGGAATLVRKAFNDLAGFCTGWVLFLDYVIVIAISALFLPHYLGGALQIDALDDRPWDVVVGVLVIAGIALVRLFRRPGLYLIGIAVAVLDLVTQILIVVLGLAFLFTPDALSEGVTIGSEPGWSDLAFALPLAMLAYTGLETVANLAEEARSPGVDIRRGLLSAIGVVVTLYVAIAIVGLSAFPVEQGSTALGDTWLFAPMLGIVDALGADLPSALADALRVFVGISGALILLAAATTSFSGFGRLAYSLGEHGHAAASVRPARPAHADRPRVDRRNRRDRRRWCSSPSRRWPRTRSRSSQLSSASACCWRSRPRSSPSSGFASPRPSSRGRTACPGTSACAASTCRFRR